MTTLTVKQELDNFAKLIEPTLESFLAENIQEGNLIIKPMRYAVLGGGKRFRPFLLYYLGCLLKLEPENLIKIGACIELFHTYTLVHDDLPSMDNDDYRRGKPSTHKAFGEATAILVGDALQSQAFLHLSSEKLKIEPEIKLEIIYLLSLYGGTYNLIIGQVLDMEFKKAGNEDIDTNNILNIHLLKTAKLFSLCGAILCKMAAAGSHSNNSDSTNAQLNHNIMLYCEYLGLIWQIIDDFNDALEDTKQHKEVNLVLVVGEDKANKILANFTLKINKTITVLNTHFNSHFFSDLLNYITSNKK